MNWVSPLTVDETKTQGKTVATLLRSSAQSWLRRAPISNLTSIPTRASDSLWRGNRLHPLAVSITGAFESYFKGKAMPEAEASATTAAQAEATPTRPHLPGHHRGCPKPPGWWSWKRRFLDRCCLQHLLQSVSGPLSQQSAVHPERRGWSVEDLDLLEIRSRAPIQGVDPLEMGGNSSGRPELCVALLALGTIGVTWSLAKRRERPVELAPRQGEKDEA